jgi:hypothetical protein
VQVVQVLILVELEMVALLPVAPARLQIAIGISTVPLIKIQVLVVAPAERLDHRDPLDPVAVAVLLQLLPLIEILLRLLVVQVAVAELEVPDLELPQMPAEQMALMETLLIQI